MELGGPAAKYMHSFSPAYLRRLAFTSAEVASMAALGEARGRQELYAGRKPEVLATLRQAALIESSESSNRIEGVTAPRARIEQLVQRRTTPRDRSEQEIAGYRDALALIHEAHEDVGRPGTPALPMPFRSNVMLQLHGLLYRYQPGTGGRFKSTDNEIVERAPDGRVLRVRFRPTPALDTPRAMDELAAGYRQAAVVGDLHPLVAIPLAVLDLLCIHPFTDGNGRVGRLAMLLLLYRHGHVLGRYISLERIVEESRETYYEALHASSKGWHAGRHDVHPWLSYVWGGLLRASREFEDRVGSLETGPANKSDLVRGAILRRVRPFTAAEIEGECPGVSREWVRRVLRELRDAGTIRQSGRGRGARWVREDQV
jgi:Fic family protein